MVEIVCPCSNSCFETRTEYEIHSVILSKSIFSIDRRKGKNDKEKKIKSQKRFLFVSPADLSKGQRNGNRPYFFSRESLADIAIFIARIGNIPWNHRRARSRLWLTMCRRSLRWGERAATLEDFVLRTVTRLPSFADRILGIVFDLTNRYSSPGCLLFFLNVPHNMFLARSRIFLYTRSYNTRRKRERERERERRKEKKN